VPQHARLEPHYAWIAAGIAALILYGSFYPFGFYAHHDPRGPLGALLRSGFRPASRDDVAANTLLYFPLGFFAFYALQSRTLPAVAGAIAAGFALSLLVELVQFYDRGRVQGLSDICANTLGALLGAAAAAAARRRVSSPYLALLLMCWLGDRWYPALPSLPMERLGPLWLVWSIPALDLLRFFAAWLAVGLMLESLVGGPRSRVALPVLLAVSVLVRALAVDVEPAEIAGGALAALAWSGVLWRLRARAAIGAALFAALVALLALAPFHFSAAARAFGWVPFRSFLDAGTGGAIRSFFEKAFLYGGMVWLLVRAGFSAGSAAAFGAALVFCLRVVQVYLPGRSAEITDTILLLLFAAVMKAVSLARPPARDAPPHPLRDG
jgi:VanZ family protein